MKKTVFVIALMSLAGFWMMPGSASSHREAPLISQDPSADNTDVYAFISPKDGDRVVLMSNFIPLQKPDSGPNFHAFSQAAVYEIHVDNNGDAVEDITFQWIFTNHLRNPNTFLYNTGQVTSVDDADLNFRQTVALWRIDGPRRTGARRLLSGALPVAPANVGPRSMPNYGGGAFMGAVNQVPEDSMRTFAGQRDEGFYVDLGIFDLLGVGSGAIEDSTAGLNIHTIAIEVPIHRLTRSGARPTGPDDPAAVIGVWSTVSRPATRTLTPGGESASGNLVQVSRLGQPLVNEAVIPLGLKDAFNGLEPSGDAVALPVILDPEVPKLLELIFGVKSPPPPRNDLVTIFLTGIPGLNQPPNVKPSEMLRLNTGIPAATRATFSRFGVLGGDVAGYPNGRRVGDDVLDITLRAAAGATPLTPAFNISPNNTLGDGVNENDVQYLETFPFLAHPHAGNK